LKRKNRICSFEKALRERIARGVETGDAHARGI